MELMKIYNASVDPWTLRSTVDLAKTGLLCKPCARVVVVCNKKSYYMKSNVKFEIL